jgi:hypothetical protein
MRIDNLSRTAAVAIPTMCRSDHERALIVAAATFVLPPNSGAAPILLDEQPMPPLADAYHGDPACSSLRVEGQSAYTRSGTDIHLRGHAWAPRGRPSTQTELAIRVGPCVQHAVVFGERVWVRSFGEVRASPPVPFERIPILWERSFGGTPRFSSARSRAVSDRNPVGRGLFDDGAEAADQPLPNFEDPSACITSLGDRPNPRGFGPIAKHWQPRRSFAGTYDQRWLDTRAPLWPKDMDERLFCAAAPGLCATPHLRGGEPVELLGVHPDGPLRFELPSLSLLANFNFADHLERRVLTLDVVDIDTDAWRLCMIWRATSDPVDGKLGWLDTISLRMLAAWERT